MCPSATLFVVKDCLKHQEVKKIFAICCGFVGAVYISIYVPEYCF